MHRREAMMLFQNDLFFAYSNSEVIISYNMMNCKANNSIGHVYGTNKGDAYSTLG